MPDFASIIGGDPRDTLAPGAVGAGEDAYYRIESANVFIDHFGGTGYGIVDGTGNPNGIRIEFGSGKDEIFSGSGGDSIWAGANADTVDGGDGDNTISGASGDDLLVGGAGRDSMFGGLGADTIRAGLGDDYAAGGSGTDSIRGEGGNDSLLGNTGDDFLYGEDGTDTLLGGSGSDVLMGGAGNDVLSGGTGGDVFAFADGFGQDVITDFRPGDQINLAADLNDTGITSAKDLVALGMVSGGTTAAGTKFTLITIGNDTIRLERMDHTDFINQIATYVKVG